MIDCSNIDNLINEMDRMCKQFKYCDECPISKFRIHGNICLHAAKNSYVDVKNAVQKWSNKNPPKTMLDDFKAKHPNAPMQNDMTPLVCPQPLGYTKEPCVKDNSVCGVDCVRCWNRPYEDGGEQE